MNCTDLTEQCYEHSSVVCQNDKALGYLGRCLASSAKSDPPRAQTDSAGSVTVYRLIPSPVPHLGTPFLLFQDMTRVGVHAGGEERFETWQCSSREAQPHPPWPIGRKSNYHKQDMLPTPQARKLGLWLSGLSVRSKFVTCLARGKAARWRPAPPTGIHISYSRLMTSPHAQPRF
jgi:hypothetical protein